MSRVFDCFHDVERARGLAAAKEALVQGKLAVLPTDTVYGVAADVFHREAPSILRAVKGLPVHAPLPVFVSSPAALSGLLLSVPPAALALAKAFWPGPLTLVVEPIRSIQWDIGSPDRVSLRMPLHPLCLELVNAVGPLAVATANVTGHRAPVTCQQAQAELGYDVDVYLAADEAKPNDTVSTVVDMTGGVPHLVRAGSITYAAVKEIASNLVLDKGE